MSYYTPTKIGGDNVTPLPITITLSENKRLGEIKLPGQPHLFALYEKANGQNASYVLTDTNDPKKVYMLIDGELWSMLFEQNKSRFDINKW
jgi:hypothetical protein